MRLGRTNGLALNAGNREADLDFRLQAASKAFYATKWILCDKNVSLKSRIKFFDSVVTSVVRFGAVTWSTQIVQIGTSKT